MLKAVYIILGVLAAIIFLVFVASSAADVLFNQKVKKEVRELLINNGEVKGEILREEDLEGLPPSVQKWLKSSGVIGKERIRTVHLKQKIQMRPKEESPWMPAEADQYFTVDKPGFVWKVRAKMAPLLYFTGRDRYFEGHGHMLIRILSLVTVADARGKEMDQGTLLRYLAETMWFPSAALSSYIKWEEIDPNSARATMSYGGVTASGVFIFNDNGDPVDFVAERYYESNGRYTLETWSTPVSDYKEFNGIRIPYKGEAVWKLKTGDFNWARFEITGIEYNN